MASYWHRVALLLEKAHQEPIAIDLPGDDASASLSDYADMVVRASIPASLSAGRRTIHVIATAGDRFFPLEFQRRVARERLNKDVEVVPGGHLVALSHPEELVDLLLRCEREV